MKCNCIKDLEKRILEKTLKENKKFIEGEARCDAKNIAFTFDSEGTRPYQVFEVQQEYQTATGKDRVRKEAVNVLFAYCPYCGRELERDYSNKEG